MYVNIIIIRFKNVIVFFSRTPAYWKLHHMMYFFSSFSVMATMKNPVFPTISTYLATLPDKKNYLFLFLYFRTYIRVFERKERIFFPKDGT